MTDAPDPGLTDLIAAHQLVSTDTIFHRNGMVQRPECKCGELMQWAGAYPAQLALVVEQHTNGRIAETVKSTGQRMYAQTKKWQERAENAEATIVRVQNALEGVCDSCDYTDLRAALEGEQQ